MGKNKISIIIDNCKNCPCATLKFDQNSEQDIMYCQTERSLMMLRENWGDRDIPNWCPLLAKQTKVRKIFLKEKCK